MQTHTLKVLILLALLTVLAAGCGGHSSNNSSPAPHPDTNRHWTILVYMAADNNLEEYAFSDFNELEMIGSTQQVSVVVQFDRIPGYDASNGNWTSTRRYYVTKDADAVNIHSTMLADLGELDMADSSTLTDFVQWGVENYPANHYMLVMWDHGRGWRTQAMRTMALQREIKAISVDNTDNSEMSLTGLAQACRQMPHMDVTLFDACLMAMLEVAYSIEDSTDVMVASEENIPVLGQPYDRMLLRITADPDMTSLAFGQAIAEEYIGYYTSHYSGNFTISAISTASVGQVASRADDLARAIRGNLASVRSAVESAQQQTQHYDFDKQVYDDYKDLYDFARLVESSTANTEVRTAAQSLREAIDDAVICERHSGADVPNSHGISIYLPNPGTMSYQYTDIDFARDTEWDEMLQSY